MNPLRQSTGPKSPIVITSKAAQKDLQNISLKHDEMTQGMQIQAIKSDAYRQQKAAELQAANVMKNEMDKEKMVANTESKKMALDFQAKQSALDVKRASIGA